jgi:hypothetical protein
VNLPKGVRPVRPDGGGDQDRRGGNQWDSDKGRLRSIRNRQMILHIGWIQKPSVEVGKE